LVLLGHVACLSYVSKRGKGRVFGFSMLLNSFNIENKWGVPDGLD